MTRDSGNTPAERPAEARFRLPWPAEYVVPAHCSSCDAKMGDDTYTYPLRLERSGQASRDALTLMLPLCAHCRRRRNWDRAGALVGMLFGVLALIVMYPLLERVHIILAVLAAVMVFFGTAIAFSILWARLTDRFVGLPRFESVLFSQPRGASYIAFVFHHAGYGERFRSANSPPADSTES
jgi:hypothetical protein